MQKRSKKGMREVDLKPMIEQAEAVPESQQLVLHLCLPSGSSSSLNPMLLLHALEDFCTDSPPDTENLPHCTAHRRKNKIFLKKHLHFFRKCGMI